MPQCCRVFPERHVRRRQARQQDKQSVTNRKRSHSEASGVGDADAMAADDIAHYANGNENKENSQDGTDENRNCTVCLRYNSMLYMDFIQANEMLVVEQPWLTVMASFPEALHRRIYGVN